MPSVSQTYSGRLLNASDLLPIGRKRVAVIHEAVVELIGQGKEAAQKALEEKPALAKKIVDAVWAKRAGTGNNS